MSSYQVRKTPGDVAWFMRDRFGMFIHWGMYALGARHEWVKKYESIPEGVYDRWLQYFDPDMYDPVDWARQAKAAGMKYAVLTTKHHEGFCMFDSQYTDYKCTNTPAGRDLVREYVEAFRAAGLKVGFYYSLIDWHHPEFPFDPVHPRRNDPDSEEQNKKRDIKKYAAYMRNQVRELMTHYGKIDIAWFDYSYPTATVEGKPWLVGKGKDDWEAEQLIALVRELQPGIIINNRTGIEQDLWTPEQVQLKEWVKHEKTGELVPWEACQTLSGSWGYHRDESTWKSPEMLLQMLITTVSCGGNFIMNVGPTARGYLDHRAEAALQVYADWMKYNDKSIYGCTKAEPGIVCPDGCKLTQSGDGKRLYVHLFAYPFRYLELPGMKNKVAYAQFLHDNSEIKMTGYTAWHGANNPGGSEGEPIILHLPVVKPPCIVPVIELFLKD